MVENQQILQFVKKNLHYYARAKQHHDLLFGVGTFDLVLASYLKYVDSKLSKIDQQELRCAYAKIQTDNTLKTYMLICFYFMTESIDVKLLEVCIDGNDLTCMFELLLLMFGMLLLQPIADKVREEYSLQEDYMRAVMRRLSHRVALCKKGIGKLGVDDPELIDWMSEHLSCRRFTFGFADAEVIPFKQEDFRTQDQSIKSLPDSGYYVWVHITGTINFTPKQFVGALQQMHKFFAKRFGELPRMYKLQSWFFDDSLHEVYKKRNMFIDATKRLFFDVDDLKEESDDILFFVYGKRKCDPALEKQDTRLKKFLAVEYSKRTFYKRFRIVKVIDGQLVFNDLSVAQTNGEDFLSKIKRS